MANSEVKAKIAGYDFIRYTLCDISGRSRCQLVPARNAPGDVEIGISVVGLSPYNEMPTSMQECRDANQGNVMLEPHWDTLHEVPWTVQDKYRVGSVLCETRRRDGQPQAAAPRYVLRKQLEELHSLGLDICSGVEYEFKLYKKGTREPVTERRPYHETNVTAQYEPFLFQLDKDLQKAGVNVTMMHNELTRGMFEVICQPKFGLETADEAFIFREALKEISHLHGYDYTFMGKPDPNTSIAFHLNVSLWDKKREKNVFYDDDKPDKLSDTFLYWLGGLTRHSRALTAICCPTVNCYRRIHCHRVPDVANWGIDHRETTFRVKNFSPSGTLIENRMPSGTANTYLTTAACIAAGIDGIKNKIEPPPIYSKDTTRLPDTLEEALTALEEDKAMVEALGQDFIDWFVQPKREFELKPLSGFDQKVFTQEWQDKEWDMYSTI